MEDGVGLGDQSDTRFPADLDYGPVKVPIAQLVDLYRLGLSGAEMDAEFGILTGGRLRAVASQHATGDERAQHKANSEARRRDRALANAQKITPAEENRRALAAMLTDGRAAEAIAWYRLGCDYEQIAETYGVRRVVVQRAVKELSQPADDACHWVFYRNPWMLDHLDQIAGILRSSPDVLEAAFELDRIETDAYQVRRHHDWQLDVPSPMSWNSSWDMTPYGIASYWGPIRDKTWLARSLSEIFGIPPPRDLDEYPWSSADLEIQRKIHEPERERDAKRERDAERARDVAVERARIELEKQRNALARRENKPPRWTLDLITDVLRNATPDIPQPITTAKYAAWRVAIKKQDPSARAPSLPLISDILRKSGLGWADLLELAGCPTVGIRRFGRPRSDRLTVEEAVEALDSFASVCRDQGIAPRQHRYMEMSSGNGWPTLKTIKAALGDIPWGLIVDAEPFDLGPDGEGEWG